MVNLLQLGGMLILMLVSCNALSGNIQIYSAWSRATAPGQTNGMVDINISSMRSATLIGVSSTAANSTELHSMSHEGGMMKMREVKSVELPAGKQVNLGESGYHLMLIGLKAPLKAGDKVPLILRIKTDKSIDEVEVRVEVQPLTANKAMAQDEGHEHMHHH